MKYKRNYLKGVIIAILTMCLLLTCVACTKTGGVNVDEKTITVRPYKGGYGLTHLTALKEKFEAVYKEEGYKVEILPGSGDMQGTIAMQQMYSANDWADVYFCGNLALNQLVDGEYGTLVLDITDTVWNQPAIDFNGNEESVALKTKLNYNLDSSYSEKNGRVYGFQVESSVGGMIVNKTKLAKYGLELPKTTNELFNCFDAIYLGNGIAKGSLETNCYPLTYLDANSGYNTHMVNAWLAQYIGTEDYENFWGLVDKDGNWLVQDGYKLFDNPGLDVMVEAIYKMHDPVYAAPGSIQNNVASAHAKIMDAKYGAVFMADGDWAYNECVTEHSATIDESLAFINIPVISALGTKLFADDGFNEIQCEEILRYVIDLTDEGKTLEEIILKVQEEKGWNLISNDVESVMRARGVFCARSQTAGSAWICSKTQKAEICYKFLRMFASDDNAKLYNEKSNGFTAYTTDFEQIKDNNFVKDFAKVFNSPYAYGVWTNPTDLRMVLEGECASNLLPKSGLMFVGTIINEGVTAFDASGENKIKGDEVYKNAASNRLKADRDYAKNQWNDWLKMYDKWVENNG